MNTTAKALLISTALALPMGMSATAQTTNPSQLTEVLSSNLSQLNISTDGLEMLSTEQMLELEGIISGGNQSDADKKQQAETYLSETLPGYTAAGATTATGATAMTTADASAMDKSQLEENLTTELSKLGVETDGVSSLSTEQMLELDGILGTAGKSDADRKQGAEAFLADAM
ncbi:hypothetical protein [Pseudoruegeria sp. SK021]|uniref:hypothetical protein n=1 Tax=Pseudoruegeria sp. SK021 TaxID=1933035 RepID=UPI000A23F6D1|nr:hypothetical protein [Pseudoruegeria sp. SK021]OSP56037.1 hypothetical protein BV911_03620 [Pseudoruegeria sp. SK021]